MDPQRRLYRKDASTVENMFTRFISVVGEGDTEETPCTKTQRNATEGRKGVKGLREWLESKEAETHTHTHEARAEEMWNES